MRHNRELNIAQLLTRGIKYQPKSLAGPMPTNAGFVESVPKPVKDLILAPIRTIESDMCCVKMISHKVLVFSDAEISITPDPRFSLWARIKMATSASESGEKEEGVWVRSLRLLLPTVKISILSF